MNMSPYRLSMDCPWRIEKLARPARLRSIESSRTSARQKHPARPTNYQGRAPAGFGTVRDERSESRRFPRTGGRDQPAEQVGAPGRTRTCGPRLRRPVLYPPELRAHE